MRERPNVAGRQFATKKQLKEYVKNLLHQKGECTIDSLDTDFTFLYELYLRKPSHQKYESSIVGFEIRYNPITHLQTDNLACVDIHGNRHVFSWNDCCNGVDKNSYCKLKEACRTSIQDQVKDTWCHSKTCSICGKYKTNQDKFEIDHAIEFCQLFDEFITQNKIAIPTDFDSNQTSQYMFKLDDIAFQQSFQQFHEKEAKLQLLCYECHRQKTSQFLKK